MAFPDNFITELVDRSDIVDVVSSYVRLWELLCLMLKKA